MTLIDQMILLKDRLDSIPKNLGVPTYKDVLVHRASDTYLVTPTPKVETVAGTGTSVPGIDFGIPETVKMQNVTVRTVSLLLHINRSNPLGEIYSDNVKYYEIDGSKYLPLSLSGNNPLTWLILVRRRVDQR